MMGLAVARLKSKRRTKRQMREAMLKTSREDKAKDFLAAALPGCKRKPVTLAGGYVWDDGHLWLGGRAVENDR